ncbi:MAG: hypothetical protein LBG06_07505 [Deltaproteobacteria bacterium]|jgi:hypothetical protein|nr:hypothetical protein [Deltaproteobacteria bacterium]
MSVLGDGLPVLRDGLNARLPFGGGGPAWRIEERDMGGEAWDLRLDLDWESLYTLFEGISPDNLWPWSEADDVRWIALWPVGDVLKDAGLMQGGVGYTLDELGASLDVAHALDLLGNEGFLAKVRAEAEGAGSYASADLKISFRERGGVLDVNFGASAGDLCRVLWVRRYRDGATPRNLRRVRKALAGMLYGYGLA